METKRKVIILTILGMLFLQSAIACSTFCIRDKEGNTYFGRNFDFPSGLGQVHINQKNVEKFSIARIPEKPFLWKSLFGSITFNQNGKELPYGGMNEAGLVVEQMMLNTAKYPELDERTGLTELQWIQYQLDVAKTVEDVINSDKTIRVSFTSVAPLHFLVSDALGNVVSIEYVDGKMVVHKGEKMPFKVLTNDTYECSLDYKINKEKDKNKNYSPEVENSSGRFMTAANMINDYKNSNENVVDYSFSILKNISQDDYTQWSIVYDIKNKKIYYKTHTNPTLRSIDMNSFDFNCNNKRLYVDIDDADNSAMKFKETNYETNYNLISRVCNSVEFLKSIPEGERKKMAGFPFAMKCAE